eukprot:m.478355 g.478355  ORF g.478355 m.478355 type:complete len:198 (+) comp21128_c0_seq1:409-1002(+)
MARVAAIVLLALSAVVAINAAEDAHLLASKELMSKMTSSYGPQTTVIAGGRPLAVKYTIYNRGNTVATDVTLDDTTFDGSVVSVGTTLARFKSIQPNSQVTHTVIMTPGDEAVQTFGAAKLTYYSGTSGEQSSFRTSWTSAPGDVPVIEGDEYARQYEAHLLEWSIFLALLAIPVGLPFLMLNRAKAVYSDKLGKSS